MYPLSLAVTDTDVRHGPSPLTSSSSATAATMITTEKDWLETGVDMQEIERVAEDG